MTFFWSSWITILSIACWAGILGVLLFVLKYKPDVEEDGTTDTVTMVFENMITATKMVVSDILVQLFGRRLLDFPAILPKTGTV